MPHPHHELLPLIYMAAAMPLTWPSALGAISRAIGGSMAALFVWDRAQQRQLLAPSWQIAPDIAERYLTDFASLDPMRPIMDGWPIGVTFDSDRAIAADVRRRDTFFQEFLIPSGGGHVLGLPVTNDSRRLISLALHREERRGPFTDAEFHAFSRLAVHLRRAVDLHERLAPLHQQAQLSMAALDAMALPVLVTDSGRRLVIANLAAVALLQLDDGLRETGGHVDAARSCDGQDLARLVAEATLATGAVGGACRLGRERVPEPLTVIATPLPASWTDRPLALLLVDDPRQAVRLPNAALAHLYRLTPAEQALAAALLEGRHLEDIAAARGVAEGTLKVHLRSIFAKTGCSRQSELLRRLAVFAQVA